MSCQVFRNDNNEIDRVEASNGEKSNLYDSILALPEISDKEEALKLWAKVYTPTFKEWFGNGVKDNNGEPLLLFHGSIKEFDTFRSNNGIFVTDNYTAAEDIYGDTVYPLFLNATSLEKKELTDLDDNREILDTSEDKEYYAVNNRDETRPITEYVVYDSNKVKSLFNDGEFSKEDDNIYYHKASEFAVSEKEYTNNIRVLMNRELVNKKKWVSKDTLDGNRTIRHTEDKSPHSPEKRKLIVETNHRYLTKLNERRSNGALPFIIEKKTSTKEKNANGDTIIIPNYTIKVNEDFLDIEWTKLKLENSQFDKDVEDGKTEGGQLALGFGDEINLSQQKETAIDLGLDTIEDVNRKIGIMQQTFDATVTMNGDLPANVYGRVKGKQIELNPTYVRKDTVIHEFGHLFVDLLGGMSNNFIKRGRMLLNGSKIESEVIKNNPELSGELLDKEIITTAIGIEGANLYDLQRESPFKAWLKIFLNKLRLAFGGLFGIDGNVALELAQQMLNQKVDKSQLTGATTNVFQNSKTMSTSEPSSEEDLQMDSLITKITDRIIILKAKYKKSKKGAAFKEEIAKLLTVLETHKDSKGLIRYSDEVSHQSENILSNLNKMLASPDPIDGDRLNNIRVLTGAFDLINDVETLMAKAISKAKGEGNERLVKILEHKLGKIKSASSNLNSINNAYKAVEDRYIFETLLPHSKIMKREHTRRYEKEFYNSKGNRALTTQYYKSNDLNVENAKNKYIEEKLLENREIIAEEEEAKLKDILRHAPRDITSSEAWITDPRNQDDNLIAIAVKLLDTADYNAMRKFITKRNESHAIHSELKEYRGGESNQKKLYEGIIEKIDGKETGHLVGKYLSSWTTAQNNFWKSFNETNTVPTKEQKIAHYKEKENYLNPQWIALKKLDTSNPVRKMYDHLTATSAEKDAITPDSYKLALYTGKTVSAGTETDINELTYKLPSVEKNTMERLYEQGLFTVAKEGVRDLIVKDTTDTEFGEGSEVEINPNLKAVLVNEQGKENQAIPIHYRGKIKKESQQSFDLVGISLMDYDMVTKYEEKSKIGGTLEVLDNYSGRRTVKVRRGGKFLINALGSSEESYVETKGISSNAYKSLHSIIQDRLYGISTIDMGDINGVNISKVSNTIMGWTGNTMLIFNKLAGAVNVVQGKYQNFLESTSGEFYNSKDIRKAESLYGKDTANIMKDIGAMVPTSKTNLLVERFDAFADFSGIIDRYSNDSTVKRLANSNTGHFINHMGEHYIQGTAMYAILNNIKVKNSKGEEIALHEAYEVKDGTLQPIEGIEIDQEFELEVSRKVKEVIKQLHGNYDSNNQAMVQRYATGKFIFMLRKWMIVGVQRRWRGARYILNKERSDDDKNFSDILDKDMEGYYTTTLRFLKNVSSDLKTLEFSMISGKWDELSDSERANVKKTIVDLSMVVLALTASTILAGLAESADDDDKELYYTLAYITRRHYSEISFYANPLEGYRILQTPAASMSMVQRTGDFISQLLFGPTERYVKGPRKGELKLEKRTKALFPVLSQLDRNVQDTFKWLVK